jgi:adenine-specific DNA-methyltransferase
MIRSELDVLLDKVEDEALRADLRTQIDRLKQRRSFGLVFEQHIPERVRLPQHPIRVGSQVVSRDDEDSPTFEVRAIDGSVATIEKVREADGSYLRRGEHAVAGHELAALDSLVVISDFGEPVLPGFRDLGSIERGGDKPHHVVINGENHHALEALRFTHAGKVDCIYVDPPYNSGARDWKYNNDYVDDNDAYRHSKWLAFMERRLQLAHQLLKPDGVVVVTIDENEVHHLGILLHQLFRGARIQMVTIAINPSGTSGEGFSRVEEYAYFAFFGGAEPNPTYEDFFGPEDRTRARWWHEFIRSGNAWLRAARPNLCYPIFIDAAGRIAGVGEPFDGPDDDRPLRQGEYELAWPVRTDGRLGIWSLSADRVRDMYPKGYIVSTKPSRGTWSIRYLLEAALQALETGEIEVAGYDAFGGVILPQKSGRVVAKTMWHRVRHAAGAAGGTAMLKAVLGKGGLFPFPKSLYAVRDTLDAAVGGRKDALILDFFAGSGTTAHAVMRLNRQDGGRRQSIMVTNNEVSAEEATQLRKRDLRPGDAGWEALGIFEHITRPRVMAAVTGRTPDGEPIKGDYKFVDEFPMAEGFEENVSFLELRYLDADEVDLGLAFDDIAPLLWLRAGAQGPIARRLDDAGGTRPYVWTDRYGVLFEEDRWRAFVADRPDSAQAAFIVTYSPTTFAGIAAELPAAMDTVRLPDTYLSMFRPDRGRA